MVTINVTYEGRLRCTATHGPSGTSLHTDAPVDNHGRGESFSPTDLCATALATCMATVMGIIAEREGVDLAGLSVTVDKVMSADSPRRIAQLPVTIRIPAEPPEDKRRILERAAAGWPVHHSLHPEIKKPVRYEWGAGPATP